MNPERIRNAAKPPRIRKVRTEDGEIAVEKCSWMPHVFMVATNGSMVSIPLTSGQNDPEGIASNHGKIRVRRLEQKGAFQVNECPMSRPDMIRHLDKDLRDTPCDIGEFGRRKMCRHVKEMQIRRQAKAKAEAEKLRAKYKTWEQKNYELLQREFIESRLRREAEMREAEDGNSDATVGQANPVRRPRRSST